MGSPDAHLSINLHGKPVNLEAPRRGGNHIHRKRAKKSRDDARPVSKQSVITALQCNALGIVDLETFIQSYPILMF
jgi:hypothetical protein